MAQAKQNQVGQAFGDLGDLFDKAMSLFNGGKAGSAGTEAAQPAEAEVTSPTATTQMPGVNSIPDFIHGYLHGSGAIGGGGSASDGSSFLQDMTGASKSSDANKAPAESGGSGGVKGGGNLASAATHIFEVMQTIGKIAAMFG